MMATIQCFLPTSRLLQRPERVGNLFEAAQYISTGSVFMCPGEAGYQTHLWRIPFSDPSSLNTPKSQKALLQFMADGCAWTLQAQGFRWTPETAPVPAAGCPHGPLQPHSAQTTDRHKHQRDVGGAVWRVGASEI